ncbi:MAG: hypothetical protein EBS19_07110 [Spirochaetia bacterium]|nr:hypothetical protein [Spirochaetia bacterium]
MIITRSPTRATKNLNLESRDDFINFRYEEEEAKREVRGKAYREIENYPYNIYVNCIDIESEYELPIEDCGNSLRPNLKITSNNNVIYNYSYNDFINGKINSESTLKISQKFSLLLQSMKVNSTKTFKISIKSRIPEELKDGSIMIKDGKSIVKIGSNIEFEN